MQDLRHEGPDLFEADLACLHSPAGLDIGSETPEEIALSILAEIQMALTHRPGGPLRQTNAPIHAARYSPLLEEQDSLADETLVCAR